MEIKKFKDKISEICGDNPRDVFKFLEKFHQTRIEKNEDETPWKLFKPTGTNNIEPGVYLTLRCGLGGIYQFCNTWDGQKWESSIADGSYTIMYKDIESYLK